jgi:hypothetical protein
MTARTCAHQLTTVETVARMAAEYVPAPRLSPPARIAAETSTKRATAANTRRPYRAGIRDWCA